MVFEAFLPQDITFDFTHDVPKNRFLHYQGVGEIFLTKILIIWTSKCRISGSEGSPGLVLGLYVLELHQDLYFGVKRILKKIFYFQRTFQIFDFFVEKT